MLTRFLKIPAVVILMTLIVTGSGCSSVPPKNLGVQENGTLADCPSSPNCVSSFAPASDKTHFIAPLKADSEDWNMLRQYLKKKPRFKIVKHERDYIHVEATTSIMHFVDDLELLFQPAQKLIQVRSASRIGYSDFGKNRSRVQHLRQTLHKLEGKKSN